MKNFSERVNLADCLNSLDYFLFFSILFLTLACAMLGNIRKKNLSEDKKFLDYMLMGRQLSLPMFVATIVATWYGGIFGVTEIAFKNGLFNFLTQGIFWYATYILFAFFLVKRIKNFDAITLPELVGQMFGPKAKFIASLFNFFNVVPITYTISLGLIIKLILPLSLLESCLLGVLFACLYSFFGGFRAIVISDIIQFFVMCSSVALVLFYSLKEFGLTFLSEKLPASHFSFTGEQGWLTTFSWGFIALSTLVDPNFYQRCFAAQDTKTAQKGILIATSIWCLFDLCTTLGAMYAAAIIPKAIPNEAYLNYGLQLLPNGLRGFFLAGIVATVLSTIDSYLFIAANTLSYDLAPARWKKNLLLSKISILATGLLSVAMAMIFSGSIKLVWKTMGSYSAGCLLLPMTLGYIKKDLINERIFIVATISSAIGITLWHFLEIKIFDDLYIGLILSGISVFLGNIGKLNNHQLKK